MKFYEIPLQAQNQTLTVSLGGTSYNLRVYWCDFVSCWILDINDASGVPILNGRAMVTGCDLLEQFQYLAIGSLIVVSDGPDPFAAPTFDNLGIASHLWYVTT